MKILALEFSSSQRSVAILRAAVHSRSQQIAEVVETGGKSARPFHMIDRCLHEAGVEREEVECVAIGLGPGSYHGIRSAISIAQGWSLAIARVRVLGLSSIDALAHRAQQDRMRGLLNLAIDAQRNEFYLSVYDLQETGVTEVERVQLVSRAALQARAAHGQRLGGPDLSGQFSGSLNLYPRAATLAELALTRTGFISADKLEPIYLRQTTFVKAPPSRANF